MSEERNERKFLGKLLLTYDGWDEVDVASVQFYNVEFPFPSMAKYNGADVLLELDGTMEISDAQGNVIWGPAFPTDIEDWSVL